nr:MOSC domain-containing protein [Actinomarinicola tropica]
MAHLAADLLADGLDHVRSSPTDVGTLDLVVARPVAGGRSVLEEGRLDLAVGLVGDDWLGRGSTRTSDGSADPDKQVNLINARFARLVAGDQLERRTLVGDQLHVDLDLSVANLPVGSRLAIGDAVVEVTPAPHKGCAKFADRFGRDAMRFVASPEGRALRLRGVCTRVVVPGVVRPGDAVVVTRP